MPCGDYQSDWDRMPESEKEKEIKISQLERDKQELQKKHIQIGMEKIRIENELRYKSETELQKRLDNITMLLCKMGRLYFSNKEIDSDILEWLFAHSKADEARGEKWSDEAILSLKNYMAAKYIAELERK